MWEFVEQHRRKAMALLVVLVPLIMVVSSAGAEVGEEMGPVDRAAGATLGGAQSGVSWMVGSVGGIWGRVVGTSELEAENEALRREVAQLREEKTRLVGVLQENARLRDMVGFQEGRPEFELAPARVIARDVTPYFRVIKLRIDSDAELRPRMPVVSADGVVGQIHRVSGRQAEVVLVADPRSRIDAVSQRNRSQGIVEGLGRESNYRARVSYLTDQDELREGDLLVTSGLGGVFPRELVIGRVIGSDGVELGRFQEVMVEPAVDFSRLEELFVITNVD